MQIDQDTLDQAIQFLIDGGETDAANLLRTCTVLDCDVVGDWVEGNRQLDGILIELGCPRQSYEILIDCTHTRSHAERGAKTKVSPKGRERELARAPAGTRARIVPDNPLHFLHPWRSDVPSEHLLRQVPK